MSKDYTYYLDSWSTDTRTWTIRSGKKLTEEEIRETWLSNSDMHKEGSRRAHTTETGVGVIVEFDGIRQGDGGEYEINGDAIADVVDSN